MDFLVCFYPGWLKKERSRSKMIRLLVKHEPRGQVALHKHKRNLLIKVVRRKNLISIRKKEPETDKGPEDDQETTLSDQEDVNNQQTTNGTTLNREPASDDDQEVSDQEQPIEPLRVSGSNHGLISPTYKMIVLPLSPLAIGN